VVAVVFLLVAWGHVNPGTWTLCLVLFLACAISNLHYQRTHTLTTIGMIPIALLSLLPPAVAGATAGTLAPALRAVCAVLSVPLGALLVALLATCVRIRAAYRAHPKVSPTAALIVLGGAIKHGRPCQTLALRLDTALSYWQEEPSRMVVVTGGTTPDGSTTEAHEMARYLRERGVRQACVLLEPTARNTRENIARSTELLDERGFSDQRCVVSSDYHLYRALRETRRLGQELTPIAAPTPPKSAVQQWCREALTIWFGR
ncbi:MAG: YdcF family protein, partial [Atopobiaceae bacterium]|nr:YdcF family protein [Atopobiaceae bacterium]